MNDLQFQELEEDGSHRFRSFYGRAKDKMPLLLADVRVPMTLRQLLYERMHGENEHDKVLLRNNYVDTACALIGDPDCSGEVIVGLYSDPLVEEIINSLNPESRLEAGALPVDTGIYQAIKKNGFVISADAVNSLRNSPHNEQMVREGFWDYATEGDAKLVRDHLSLVQERRGGSMENRMGLWVSSHPGLRLLRAMSVVDYGGSAYGYNDLLLDNYYGRLVGVLETRSVSRPGNQGFPVAPEGAQSGKRA